MGIAPYKLVRDLRVGVGRNHHMTACCPRMTFKYYCVGPCTRVLWEAGLAVQCCPVIISAWRRSSTRYPERGGQGGMCGLHVMIAVQCERAGELAEKWQQRNSIWGCIRSLCPIAFSSVAIGLFRGVGNK